MTLIASWVAMDDKKEGKMPSSLYLASDSQITYLDPVSKRTIEIKQDHKKVFCSTNYPEIFAICGDYQWCKREINQIIKKIDQEDYLSKIQCEDDKIIEVKDFFSKEISKLYCESVILYGTKIDETLFLTKYVLNEYNISFEKVKLGTLSSILSSDGSGKADFENKKYIFERSYINEDKTSRGAFRQIYDAIKNSNNPYVGGKMQAAAIYRGKRHPRSIAIYYDNEAYLFGKIIDENKYNKFIEYRNENFEIINSNTGKIKENAQRQPFKKYNM